METVSLLLQRPESLLGDIAGRRVGIGRTAALIAVAVAGTAAFGAAVGSYVGGMQTLHAAVKMPILFLGTLAVSFLLMHVLGAAFGLGLAAGQTASLCLTSIAVTGTVLGALAPLLWLLAASAPYPDYAAYLHVVLAMTAAIAAGGLVSLLTLIRGLRTAARGGGRILRTVVCWLLIYHFVGGQMAWLLRPFVGDHRDVFGGFSIERNLKGNIYEGVFNAIRAASRDPEEQR